MRTLRPTLIVGIVFQLMSCLSVFLPIPVKSAASSTVIAIFPVIRYLLSAIDVLSVGLRYATFLHRYNTTFRNNVKQKATTKNKIKLHIAYILQKWYIVRER